MVKLFKQHQRWLFFAGARHGVKNGKINWRWKSAHVASAHDKCSLHINYYYYWANGYVLVRGNKCTQFIYLAAALMVCARSNKFKLFFVCSLLALTLLCSPKSLCDSIDWKSQTFNLIIYILVSMACEKRCEVSAIALFEQIESFGSREEKPNIKFTVKSTPSNIHCSISIRNRNELFDQLNSSL